LGYYTFNSSGKVIHFYDMALHPHIPDVQQYPMQLKGMRPIKGGTLAVLTQRFINTTGEASDALMVLRDISEQHSIHGHNFITTFKIEDITIAEDHIRQHFILMLLRLENRMFSKGYICIPFSGLDEKTKKSVFQPSFTEVRDYSLCVDDAPVFAEQQKGGPVGSPLQMAIAMPNGDFMHLIHNPIKNRLGYYTFNSSGLAIRFFDIPLHPHNCDVQQFPLQLKGMFPCDGKIFSFLTQRVTDATGKKIDAILILKSLLMEDETVSGRCVCEGKIKDIMVGQEHSQQGILIDVLLLANKILGKDSYRF
jgi:hypothetical protein